MREILIPITDFETAGMFLRHELQNKNYRLSRTTN